MTLLIAYALMALVFSFLCSIAEAVLLSTTHSFVASLEKKGEPAGSVLRKLKNNIDRPLAAILSLNTIAHTVGAVGVGAQAAALFGGVYIGIASAIMTLLVLVLSEIIPKTLGTTYWRTLAPWVGRFVRALIYLLYPLVLLSEQLTQLLSGEEKKNVFRKDEFAALADLGAREGVLEAEESRILKNLFRFRSLKVRDILTPRTVVFALQEDMTVDDFLKNHSRVPFSRIPVYGKNNDDITGFVLKDELVLAHAKDRHEARLHEFKRLLHALPGTISLSDFLEFLLDHRKHIVLVVDEYGGMEGIATLEDAVETLLGLEIVDEADKTVDMQVLARAKWEKRAKRLHLIPEEPQEEHEDIQPRKGDTEAGN
jgi:CBS domain containing-hemolysin-like protein